MDLFGMGIGEILLILVVALVIWGPGKIPEIARTLGKTLSTLRKASLDLTTQVKKELDAEEKKESASPPGEKDKDAGGETPGSATEDSEGEEAAEPKNE